MGPARSLHVGLCPFRHGGAPSKGRRNRDLPFVRRGGILLRRGNAICVAFPPPSLGVSSLDLGRLHPRAAPFFALRWASCCGCWGICWRQTGGALTSPVCPAIPAPLLRPTYSAAAR